MLSPQQNYVMFLLVTLTLQYVHTSISYISSFSWYSTTTHLFTLYTSNIYGQHHIASSLVVKEFQGAYFCQRIPGCVEGAWIQGTYFSLTKNGLFKRLKFQAPMTKERLKLVLRLKKFSQGYPY